MIVLYILIAILILIILLLVLTLYQFARKSIFISDKEKDFIIFVIDIFIEYGDDLGIQSKEQHKKLVQELEKIKKKHLKSVLIKGFFIMTIGFIFQIIGMLIQLNENSK